MRLSLSPDPQTHVVAVGIEMEGKKKIEIMILLS